MLKSQQLRRFFILHPFFAREAVFLVFVPPFEAWIAILRRCAGSARFDCLHSFDLVIVPCISLVFAIPTPHIQRLTDIPHSFFAAPDRTTRTLPRHPTTYDCSGWAIRRKARESQAHRRGVGLVQIASHSAWGQIAKTCRSLFSSPPSWRRHQTNSPRLVL